MSGEICETAFHVNVPPRGGLVFRLDAPPRPVVRALFAGTALFRARAAATPQH